MKKPETGSLSLFRDAILASMLFLTAVTGYPQGGRPGIDISSAYPQYWEYGGQPVMLLGGSVEDNLFQIPDLESHLDLLASVGGNYVRNTMSSRDSGNVWAFRVDSASGKYDLDRWNETYWDRFRDLLELTSRREIIVQVEVWATFDFYRDNWAVNPFNPVNNLNYTSGRTKLPEVVSTHPTSCDNPFFWSIPSHQNNMPVLEYQQKFVDRLLSISLQYDHVLYCIDNETSVTALWGAFWSDYIRKKAAGEGKKVHVTEMWDPWDLDHISHRESFDHPEIYSFVEISQNNHQRGEAHWINGLRQIGRLKKAGNLRPVNNVKTYGADGGSHGGGTRNGIESFVRSTLFGSAAVRFHRPPSGLGLTDTAQAVIRGMRDAIGRVSFFDAAPCNELLEGRSENEAYCRGIPGKEFLVYFPGQGSVELQTGPSGGSMAVFRMELLEGAWLMEEPEFNEDRLRLESNGEHTIFIIRPAEEVRDSTGTVRLCLANPSYLEYQGKPVILITSAEHYGAVLNADFDYVRYLEALGREGFNYTRIFSGSYLEPPENIFGIERNTLAPLPGNYISPWMEVDGRYDLERFNPLYFERLRDFLREAAQQDIIVEVTLFTSIYAQNAWQICPFHAGNNVNGVGDMDFHRVNTLFNGDLLGHQESLVRNIVRELNEFDNLFYEIQNEPWADNPNLVSYLNEEDDRLNSRAWQKKAEIANGVAMDWQRWVVSIIANEEKQLPKKHLIAQNICNFQYQLEKSPDGVSILNFHYAQPDAVLINRHIPGVIGLDETGFMPHEDEPYIYQAWRFILSGGGLYNNLDYSFTTGNEDGRWPIPDANPGWGGPRFREKLSWLVESINSVPFHEMAFSDSILHSGGKEDLRGTGEERPAALKQYGLQKPGRAYLVFLEDNDGAGVVPAVPAGSYGISWLDVNSGERSSEKVRVNGKTILQPPFGPGPVVMRMENE